MKHLPLVFWLVCALCHFCATSQTYAHGFAGARFFPATLSSDDPFVADELSLPTVSTIRTPDDGGTRQTDISVDIAKRITPQLGIEIGETLDRAESTRRTRSEWLRQSGVGWQIPVSEE